jgi:S1-C subfamily serine protease
MRRGQLAMNPADHGAQSRTSWYIALVALTSLLTVLISVARTGEVRTWKAAAGNFSVEAELLELKPDGTVRLKRKDGLELNVPLDKLSAEDQQFARGGSAAPNNAPDAPPSTALKTAEQVERDASGCKTAKEAVLVYKFYLAQSNLPADQRALATAKMKEWEDRAAKDLIRLGKDWVTPEEAEKTRKQAEAKIEKALEYLRLKNGDLARKTLEEASKLDPDSIQADFLMGLVYSVIANNDVKGEFHFQKCLKREPDNVSVLNNLAVTMVFQKKYVAAAQSWKKAAAASPKFKGLTQNIGTVISEAGTGGHKIPEKTLKELSELYEELIDKHGAPRPAKLGYVMTPPYSAEAKKGRSSGGETGGKKETVVVGSGTGFVIAPNIILTNRHVTEGSSGILILDPANPRGEPLLGELIAELKSPDLALIRCRALKAPPVMMVDKLPTRGSDIMVLGYPLGQAFGKTLKTTRGAIVAMPDPAVDNMFLYDAVTNPGNSGGPLCDKSGRVAGVVRAVTGGIGGSYGAGIPIADALPFIRKHIPDFKLNSGDGVEVAWNEVDARVSPSTVLILCQQELGSDGGIGDSGRK